MDTTRKISASTITEFLKSRDKNESTLQDDTGRQRTQLPRYHEQQQLYPPPPPPPAYYYYPPPLPPMPPISYIYTDFLKHMSQHSEMSNYLPKSESESKENKKKCEHETKNNVNHDFQGKECDHSCHNDSGISHLCQHLQCNYCSKSLASDKPCLAPIQPPCNMCQHLLHLQMLMHFQHYGCVCQKQKEIKTKHKSEKKSNKNKSNQTCLQYEQEDIPERDSPPTLMKSRGKTTNRTYCKDETSEYSDSEDSCSQSESKREDCEYDKSKSKTEQRFGFYVGEGDENKNNLNLKKFGTPNKIRKTRHSLAYFINV